MKRIYYVAIVILAVIIVALSVLLINEKKKNNIITNVTLNEGTDNERYQKLEYDLKKISFNGLKIGDSVKGATPIMDYNYLYKNNVNIKIDDNQKITSLYLNSDFDSIIYNNIKLTSLENVISVLGQYNEKKITYNSDNEYYEFVYTQYENKDTAKGKEYTLTVRCNEKLEIFAISLDYEEYYIMG